MISTHKILYAFLCCIALYLVMMTIFFRTPISQSQLLKSNSKCKNNVLSVKYMNEQLVGSTKGSKITKIYGLPYAEMKSFVHPNDIITRGILLKTLSTPQEWTYDVDSMIMKNKGVLLLSDQDNCISQPSNIVFNETSICNIQLLYKFDHIDDLIFIHIYIPTNKPTTIYSSFVSESSTLFTNKNIEAKDITSGYYLLIKNAGINEKIYFAAESECKSEVYKEDIDMNNREDEHVEKGTNSKEISSRVYIPQTVEVKPINRQVNVGGVTAAATSRSCNLWDLVVKIREVENKEGIIYIPVLISGGPADFYYLVREEDSRRGDPTIDNIMHYGVAAGSFDDEKITIAVNNYIPTVRNVIYIAALKGECEYGVFKRRFFP